MGTDTPHLTQRVEQSSNQALLLRTPLAGQGSPGEATSDPPCDGLPADLLLTLTRSTPISTCCHGGHPPPTISPDNPPSRAVMVRAWYRPLHRHTTPSGYGRREYYVYSRGTYSGSMEKTPPMAAQAPLYYHHYWLLGSPSLDRPSLSGVIGSSVCTPLLPIYITVSAPVSPLHTISSEDASSCLSFSCACNPSPLLSAQSVL